MAAEIRVPTAFYLLSLCAERGLGQPQRIPGLHLDRPEVNLHLSPEDCRGLRLCVNQDGERVEDKNINILYIMANERFADFAEKLQKEIEEETGVKFGVLQLGLFAGVTFQQEVTREHTINQE